MCLFANKYDLVLHNQNKRAVPAEEIAEFAQREGLVFLGESSALADINVKASVDSLLEHIYGVQSSIGFEGVKAKNSSKLGGQKKNEQGFFSKCCYR